MKVCILAGGYGTRISEESHLRPKPMIEIGEKPVLWHIMKTYSHYGYNDFVICCGYKGYAIKEYFSNYFLHTSDITFDFTDQGRVIIHDSFSEQWKVTVVDTGLDTMTGGRIKRVRKFLGDETFMLTYGDGLADVDLDALLSFHRKKGGLVTLTAVQPAGKFGAIHIGAGSKISHFLEKPKGDGSFVSGGYFVCEPQIFDYIENDTTVWERGPLETMASEGKLFAYKHEGFWQPMDTMRDKNFLESLWNSPTPPWKKW